VRTCRKNGRILHCEQFSFICHEKVINIGKKLDGQITKMESTVACFTVIRNYFPGRTGGRKLREKPADICIQGIHKEMP
jgi:hypothetical protein